MTKLSSHALRDYGINLPQLLLYGGLALVLYTVYQGGLRRAAEAAARAAGNAVVGAAEGGVNAVGDIFGLPTTHDVTPDPRVARWLIDDPRGGYFEASRWATPLAIVRALRLSVGSGSPPPSGTALSRAFPPYIDG